ncbi:hypothetical protein K7X08_011958 [Anisodus acutangulus]|uniref:Amine oxidase domain-containing protein n=1 Tax=Anisodus acutangulus TaxID=402998 RepID=A0A9Q1L9U8_9SOLA|nr:hypothetical protein K7X08_011958 [Anisodus acutangulus]
MRPDSLLLQTDIIRQEFSEDMSISRAISMVFDRRPDLRLDGIAHKVLQWYLCDMECWFAADADTISLKCWDQVTQVVRRYNGVKVTVEDGRTFVADAAVIAVPLGVLKSNRIKFEPRLPEWKEAAINELVYMPAGQLARDIEKLSDEDAAYFAYKQLQRILLNATTPIQHLVSRWGTNVNSLGSYSYDTVGKTHEFYERLRIPVDNIFFAGEATSMDYPGSMHGAYSTGLVAAEDCRMRVLERYGELDLFQPAMAVAIPLIDLPREAVEDARTIDSATLTNRDADFPAE